MKTELKVGDICHALNIFPLKGNEVAPPIDPNVTYKVLQIIQDTEGNDHIDIGLKSTYNWITSHETEEKLPNGDTIHWCHPSRLGKIN